MLALRRRGEDDFLILHDGRVLMTSRAHRSECALAEAGLARLPEGPEPRVLIGGLGMGYTLRAALDVLPPAARVRVAELHGCVVEWCRGPIAGLSGDATRDPRVRIDLADVARVIASGECFDAILLDLYVGPHTPGREDPLWGDAALARTAAALSTGGVFGIWSEGPDARFEKRLRRAGFEVSRTRPGRGGLRHVVYTAVRVETGRFREGSTRVGRSRGRGPGRRSSTR